MNGSTPSAMGNRQASTAEARWRDAYRELLEAAEEAIELQDRLDNLNRQVNGAWDAETTALDAGWDWQQEQAWRRVQRLSSELYPPRKGVAE